jgi:hypothetical protein
MLKVAYILWKHLMQQSFIKIGCGGLSFAFLYGGTVSFPKYGEAPHAAVYMVLKQYF